MSNPERVLRSTSESGGNDTLSLQDIAEIASNPGGHTNLQRTTAMIKRNAVHVLGPDLASRAEDEMTAKVPGDTGHSTYDRTGTRVIHTLYAKSLPTIAKGMEWDETNPNLRVLSAGLYEHQVGLRATESQQELLTLKTDINTRIESYKADHPLTEDVDLILKIFTMPRISTDSRRAIMRLMREGRKDDFYNKLNNYREQG